MSPEAFLEIWTEMEQSLKLSASRYAKSGAEDVVQDVFIAALSCSERFQSPEHCRSWLRISVRNKAIDYFRKNRKQASIVTEPPTTDRGPAVPADAETKMLHEAIRMLPRRQRQIISLELEGESTESIAKALEVTTSTVRSLRRYARLRIAQHLIELERGES